jgi:predicted PurR-regulated permease PerM
MWHYQFCQLVLTRFATNSNLTKSIEAFVKQIDKYIGQTIFSGIAIVLLILIGLFTFFAFIDFNQIHRGFREAN